MRRHDARIGMGSARQAARSMYRAMGLGAVAVGLGCSAEALVQPSESPRLATYSVSSSADLQTRLQNAQPGDIIVLQAGTYTGNTSTSGDSKGFFYSGQSGTSSAKIILKSASATSPAVLWGTGTSGGYVFYLTGDHWEIQDVKFTNAQKGVVLDNANRNLLKNVEIYNVGHEALHFRDGSTYNVGDGLNIHDTGKTNAGFGEGVYYGSAKSNWANYSSTADNYNTVKNSTIGPNVTAEHADIKEGTVGNVFEYNTLNGTGMTGANYGDSFVDAKGNDAIIRNNVGYRNGNASLVDAFQVHTPIAGSTGLRNRFENNTVYLDNTTAYVVTVQSGGSATVCNNTRSPSGNMYSGPATVVTTCGTTTPTNQAPSVSITSPSGGATFTAGSNVTINASASDSDGTVAKVEFFQGSTKLGEDTSSPYSYTWTAPASGTYSLTARATDNAAATTTSSAVSITVGSSPPPTGGTINETFGSSAANFTAVFGTWGVSNGQYAITVETSGSHLGSLSVHNTAITASGWTLDARGAAVASSSGYDDFAVVWGYQNSTNYYFASFSEGNQSATNGVFKVVNGTRTQLADITATTAPGTTLHAVKVVKSGSTYTVSRGGTTLATVTDGTFTSGKVGFGSYNDMARFDDLVVQ